jgi:hypothetical protein
LRQLRWALLAAAAGVIALVLFFRAGDPSGIFPISIDRAQAVERARRLTERYGVKPDGWRIDVTTIADEKLRAYREEYGDDPAGRLFTPLDWGVRFTAKDGQFVRVRL